MTHRMAPLSAPGSPRLFGGGDAPAGEPSIGVSGGVTVTVALVDPQMPRSEQIRPVTSCAPAAISSAAWPSDGGPASEPHASPPVRRNPAVRSRPSMTTAKLRKSSGLAGSPAATRNTTTGLSRGTVPPAGGVVSVMTGAREVPDAMDEPELAAPSTCADSADHPARNAPTRTAGKTEQCEDGTHDTRPPGKGGEHDRARWLRSVA